MATLQMPIARSTKPSGGNFQEQRLTKTAGASKGGGTPKAEQKLRGKVLEVLPGGPRRFFGCGETQAETKG